VQEMFDLTVRAFNLAETYRTPVMLMASGLYVNIHDSMTLLSSSPRVGSVRLTRCHTFNEQGRSG
jgi:pyruvate/2-oxoacid:ferredoxin oxidoreductase alpha subunit